MGECNGRCELGYLFRTKYNYVGGLCARRHQETQPFMEQGQCRVLMLKQGAFNCRSTYNFLQGSPIYCGCGIRRPLCNGQFVGLRG